MTTWLAITRNDVADYINTLVLVYLVLIFIRILTSWIPRMPYNRYLAAFLKFVSDVTDPYLNLFRRILPPVRMGPGALDLSPIVATFVLIIVSTIVVGAIRPDGG
jgi:YggT family protein